MVPEFMSAILTRFSNLSANDMHVTRREARGTSSGLRT